MGIFGGKPKREPPRSRPNVRLTEPKADDDPLQLVHKCLDIAGLNLLAYGPGDIGSCFRALVGVAPVFQSSVISGDVPYLGAFPGKEEILWTAIEGPRGSGIAVHCFPEGDTDFITMQITMKLRDLHSPWTDAFGFVDANVPADFADIFYVAGAVPLFMLPGLERLRRPGDQFPISARVKSALLADGWKQVGQGSFLNMTTFVAGQQSGVLFGPTLEGFELSFRLATDADHETVERIPRLDSGPYQIEVAETNTIWLNCPIPIGADLSPPVLDDAARRLVEFGEALRLRLSPASGVGGAPPAPPAPPAAPCSSPFGGPPSPAPDSRPPRPPAAVSIPKGGNVSLAAPAVLTVGLGWDVHTVSGADFDLDASAIATGSDRQVLTDQYFVFFNNLRSPDGAIVHAGDNLTGLGDGDDETIDIDLTTLSPAVTNIFFAVSIYDAATRGQSFGQVRNAYIRVVDPATGRELARHDLSGDAFDETAMVFGELYRRGAEWKFRAIGQGYASGLGGIARDYGVNVD